MSSHYIPNTRIPTLVFSNSSHASRHVAVMIVSLMRQKNSAGQPTVLGLPTGSSPVGVYRELIRMHKEGLDFARVITFNLDEYFGLSHDDPRSYHRWMQETFFNHVNIKPENIHIPDGTIREEARTTKTEPGGRAASPCRCSASAAPDTSASTSPARHGTAAPASPRLTR